MVESFVLCLYSSLIDFTFIATPPCLIIIVDFQGSSAIYVDCMCESCIECVSGERRNGTQNVENIILMHMSLETYYGVFRFP